MPITVQQMLNQTAGQYSPPQSQQADGKCPTCGQAQQGSGLTQDAELPRSPSSQAISNTGAGGTAMAGPDAGGMNTACPDCGALGALA